MLGLATEVGAGCVRRPVESVLTSENAEARTEKRPSGEGTLSRPAGRSTKTFVCSGGRAAGSRRPSEFHPRGLKAGYNAQSASLVFSQYLLKTDTDKAFEMAQQHGGDAIVKKDAKQPITYVLLKDKKVNVPVWYVIYGASEADRKGIGVINATTGAFISACK